MPLPAPFVVPSWFGPTVIAVGLQPVDYVIIFFYLAGMLAMGWLLSRKQGSVEDFFVGGRRMPWLATGLSLIATLMSTLSYLGAPGEMIKHGVTQFLGILAYPLVLIVVWTLWVPFFMRLRLTSAYEYLDLRFGPRARLLGVMLYLYMRFLWMGAILYSASLAVSQITQETAPEAISRLTGGGVTFDERSWFYFVLLATGLVSTLYTMLGGIAAVIWTDVVQFVVLFLGAVATLIVVSGKTGTGPVDWWQEVTRLSHETPPLASWNLAERNTVLWSLLGMFFWHVCTHASDQVALQRYFSNPDVRSARKTAIVGMVMDVAMQVLLGMVGAALLVYYLRHSAELPAGVADPREAGFSDRIFPHFINYGLPAGISGFVVAALFAVAQSSIDSGINATTTVITIDLIRKHRRTPPTIGDELSLARWLTLAIGVIVTAAGVAVSFAPAEYNLIDLQLKSFNCVLGPLGAIFMAGMLLRHVGETAIVLAGTVGAVSGVLFGFMDVFLTPVVQSWSGNGNLVVSCPSPFLIIPLSWLVTFVLAALLGGFTAGPTDEQVQRFTWRGVRIRNARAA